jgi:hypothetical protein
MSVLARSLARVVGGVARVVRWSLSSVDDEPAPRPLPLPGPAHGPVHAIDLRLGRERRRF